MIGLVISFSLIVIAVLLFILSYNRFINRGKESRTLNVIAIILFDVGAISLIALLIYCFLFS